jgi:hypothetical protein
MELSGGKDDKNEAVNIGFPFAICFNLETAELGNWIIIQVGGRSLLSFRIARNL